MYMEMSLFRSLIAVTSHSLSTYVTVGMGQPQGCWGYSPHKGVISGPGLVVQQY